MSSKLLTDEEFIGGSAAGGGTLLSDEEFIGSTDESAPAKSLLSDDEFIGGAAPEEEDRSVPFGSVARGFNRLQQAGNVLGSELGLISDADAAKAISRDEADIARYPPSPAVKEGMAAIGGAKGWADTAYQIITHPSTIASIIGESIPASVASQVAGAVTSVGGRSTVGLMAGTGLGSFATEYSSTILDTLRDEGVDINDPEQVAAAFSNDALMARARERGVKRGVPVATFDAISFGIAGRISRAIEGGAEGVSTLRKVVAESAEVGAQGVSGAGGEAGAQLADKGEISSPGDVLLEGAAEVVTGVPEIALGRARTAPKPAATGIPEGAAPAETLFGAESAGGVTAPSAPADTGRAGPPPPARPTPDPEIERPDSPRLTPADRASPLPNDLIDDGRKLFEDALAGKPVGQGDPRRAEAESRVDAIAAEFAARPQAVAAPVGGAATAAGGQALPASPAAGTARILSDEEFISGAAAPQDGTLATVKGLDTDGDASRPAVIENASQMDAAGLRVNTEPTERQKQAGNYRKGHIKVSGLDITIENPKGSVRRGTDPDGKAWESTLPAAYGYIKGSRGADNDQVDVYVGDEPQAPTVYVVDQIDADTLAHDEHKAMLGFPSREAALQAYEQAFSDERGAERVGNVTEMSVDEFKDWVRNGDTTAPLSYEGPARAAAAPQKAAVSVPIESGSAPAAEAGLVPQTTEQKVTPARIKPEPQRTASWVIRDKATGGVVMETFDRAKVNALNTAKYEAVPIQEHLAGPNRRSAALRLADEPAPQRALREKIKAKREAPVAGAKQEPPSAKTNEKPAATDKKPAKTDEDFSEADIPAFLKKVAGGERFALRRDGGADLSPGGGTKQFNHRDTTIDYGVSRDGDTAEIILVKTPKNKRGLGSARSAAEQLLRAFDSAGITAFLTAEPMDRGVSKSGLVAFYKSLGFRENKGRQKDFRSQAAMVREPQARFSLREGRLRQQGIPSSAVNLAPFDSDAAIKAHADYRAAKGGDRAAAVRMIADIVPDYFVRQAAEAFGSDVIYAGAHAEEASGRNAIPTTFAAYLAERTGAVDDQGITQTNKAYHTGAKPMERLLARATFGGEVEPGGRYVLVDDVTVMGSTLADMADHIRRNGGEVVGIATLANASRSGVLAAPKHRVALIERRFGDVVRSELGLDPASLTGSEAQHLLDFRDADALRDRIAKARQERNERLRSKGLQPPAEDQGQGESRLKLRATDSFASQAQDIGKRLRAELDRLGLKDVGLKLADEISFVVDGKRYAADGQYFRKLITIALDAENPDSVLDHEAIHALRDADAFNKTEWQILERKSRKEWMDRYEIAEAYGDFPEWAQVEEGIAHAYADWREGRQTDGIIAKVFKKIRSIIQAIGRAFGKDFRSVSDVFADVASGELGARARPGEEFFAAPPNAEGEERFKLKKAPQTAEDQQKVMQGFIARGQPLDRAIRLPFDILGGLDAQGRWNPGKRLVDKIGSAGMTGASLGGVVGAGVGTFVAGPPGGVAGGLVGGSIGAYLLGGKINQQGRFGWLHGFAENARRGLIDRYGLDDAYLDADRKRELEKRAVLQKADEILKVLSNASVGTQEAQVLHKVLTGEAVADAEMTKLAVPIREAIDQLGAEAVSLGLISAESYERNRGSYLHRVYLKNEVDQGIAGWVSRKMTARRKKIVGDQLKGRGLFWDVPFDRLLRYSEAAVAMRKADSRIGEAETRIETMTGRRKVLEAEIEALGREMAAHMGRRMDVADRATIKKMVGESRVTEPSSFQKGQVREQAVALNRLRDRIEQKEAALDKIAGEIVAAEQRLDALSDHLIAQSENLSVTKGRKFLVLDKKADVDGKERVTRRIYLPADEQVPQQFAGPDWTHRGEWEARAVGKDKVTLWRDYTKEERTKMGEIVDARYTIGKTFMLMANDLAAGRFYKQISENENWSRATAPATKWVNSSEYRRSWNDPEVAWVKVSDEEISSSGGKKKWGALAGQFVRAEIWRDLNELDVAMSPGAWRSLLRTWKLNKTARNPVVHMNNIASNMMFMDLADVRTQDLIAGIQAYAQGDKSKDFREARDNGAFGSDMISQEIRDNVLKPILDEIAQQQQGGVTSPFLARAGMLGKIADKLWTWAKVADERMISAYQAEDEIFRMAAYMRRRAQGESPEVAARNANEQFLNYDIRAPWVNAARNTVLPFISYTYRAVPKLAENMAHRPWKIAKYMAIAYAVNALAYLWDDGDDGEERERAALRDEEQGFTWLGTPRMLRMPWRDGNGLPVFLDIRRWIPGGDVFDTGQGSSALPIPAPLQFGGPLMLGAEFALNRQAFTGKDITNELTDDSSDMAENTLDWAWKAFMPSNFWTPNSYYWDRITNAIYGATDAAGRPYSVPQAFLSSVGVKVRPLDVEDGLKWQSYDYKKVNDALKAAARSLARQRERNLISQESFDSEMADLMKKFGNLEADYKEFAERSKKKTD